MEIIYKGVIYRSGDIIIANIDGHKITDCKLYIDHTYQSSSMKAYICHNQVEHSGSNSPDKLGYKYSWCFYSSPKPTDYLTDNVTLLENLSSKIDARKNLVISFKLLEFLSKYNGDIYSLFLSNKYLSDYNTFDISNNTGMIKLSNPKGKIVEIKIGRYLTQSLIDSITLSNSDIEKIVNEFVSFQKDNQITIEYVNGINILDGYKKENQLSLSILGNSCMNDKLDLLDLYTQNEIVSMMIIKSNDKIIGRSLIWTIDGISYMDRPYTAYDWVITSFDDEAKSKGYLRYGQLGDTLISIKLDKFKFKKYPYVDTFRWLTEDGYLHNQPVSDSKRLDTTTGDTRNER